jgi:hypothetical protein
MLISHRIAEKTQRKQHPAPQHTLAALVFYGSQFCQLKQGQWVALKTTINEH